MHIYDETIAGHYAAYRPPLHRLIVGEVFAGLEFETGLDIGCGTGRSTLALADKCGKVFGVDSSQHMLDKATGNPKVTYLFGSGHDLPLPDASVDVVTFAGALSYLDADAATDELKRVCRKSALICPYDFEIILRDLLQAFGLSQTRFDDPYDHARNLSAQTGLSTLKMVSRMVDLTVTGPQAAHILLSEKSRWDRLSGLLGTPDPFDRIVDGLERTQWSGRLQAEIHYTLHRQETCTAL